MQLELMNEIKTPKRISFIAIARNESFAIKKCLASLEKCITPSSEVILVDSDSSDDTLHLMLSFAQKHKKNCRVLKCSGYLNAATARNAGANRANGDYLFFVDGDTEINEMFVSLALEKLDADSRIAAVTGQLSEALYDKNHNNQTHFIHDRNKISRETYTSKFGGNIIIRKSALDKSGQWDENFTINEDFELAIRISQVGKIIALPIPIGTHHTTAYSIQNRALQDFSLGRPKYYGALLRKYLTKSSCCALVLKTNKGHLIAMAYYLASIISTAYYFMVGNLNPLIAVALIILLDIIHARLKKIPLAERLTLRCLYPIQIVSGFFSPPHKSNSASTEILELYPQ